MSTYDVKVWDPRKIGDTAKGRWRVRWAVAGREHCKSFAARPLADGFAAALKDAIRDHRPFDENTGLPAQPGHAAAPCSWYDHARAYTEHEMAAAGPDLPAVGRRGADHHHPGPDPPPARRPRPPAPVPRPVRLGVQPRHPQPHAPRRHHRRAGLDRRRVPARHRPG